MLDDGTNVHGTYVEVDEAVSYTHLDVYKRQVILGHSNVATTLNLYVHPNLNQKKRCIDLSLIHI